MQTAAQRQRKLAAKTARRKAVLAGKKALETSSSSLAGRVGLAAKGRIVKCLMLSSMFEQGIGHVIVARVLPSGLVGCAFFLVDVFCLGVKDVFYDEFGQSELRAHLEHMAGEDDMIAIEPTYARKLVRDAAAYAASFGLSPAKDTPVIEAIFGDVDPAACTETFTFGRDGKPFYINGPYDRPARIRTITQALEKAKGEGGWDYLIGAPEA